ncbi:type VI secretion system-associated protein TagF [Burkholderia sp. Ac-20365]|jgi:type VI secretion system protein ImpM|uniref:type VI secretion system-associated protein TagF n=1 Tax=Burkholderia sp. Ac-20365 TaxID=2703897 RepID=UPI00197C8571|nr:type VI secretion system-associated protein TagF [Burkholderia sp. Ac-20365]MBN3761819.1 type VI secretion system-associated protein TagF [Burkholderia sp. Ac-20365]
MSAFAAAGPGFFGKVRTHGDFVTRRLPADFVTPWDACLQQGMLFAQRWFDAQWLPVYLNAPVWCFALGADVCGESAWAGVLMPGVDRVGRYFPFTLAAPLAFDEFANWLGGAQAWYDEATRRALSTLEPDFVLERFDAELDAWGPLTAGRLPTPTAAWRLHPADEAEGENTVSVADADAEPADDAPERFSALLVRYAARGSGVWWTQGSGAVPASMLAGPGLPDGERFVGLLDKTRSGWRSVVELRV